MTIKNGNNIRGKKEFDKTPSLQAKKPIILTI
jgi:hypothetical protein